MTTNTNAMLCILVFITILFGTSDAYVWSWMWGGPYVQGESQQLGLTTDDQGVLAAGDLALTHPRNLRTGRGDDDNSTETSLNEITDCNSDKACGRGFFCDLHYGGCHRHRRPGQQCRRDGHCQKGFDCIFGTCQRTIPEGRLGARCRHDKDCGDSMCCAKQHGESVCKQKLPVNSKCYIPQGGVEYVIDTICPCDEGLVCRETLTVERREQEFVLKFWRDREHMRCQPR